ncbi:MAG: hypothetical protein VYA84_06380, partial [Planctomycetota bacterium]|nr:hypothetical protein [Planctomycetota bacterium]
LVGEAAHRPKPSPETNTTEGPHLGVRVLVSGKMTTGLLDWVTGLGYWASPSLTSFWAAMLFDSPVVKLRRDFAWGTTENSSLFCS